MLIQTRKSKHLQQYQIQYCINYTAANLLYYHKIWTANRNILHILRLDLNWDKANFMIYVIYLCSTWFRAEYSGIVLCIGFTVSHCDSLWIYWLKYLHLCYLLVGLVFLRVNQWILKHFVQNFRFTLAGAGWHIWETWNKVLGWWKPGKEKTTY